MSWWIMSGRERNNTIDEDSKQPVKRGKVESLSICIAVHSPEQMKPHTLKENT